MSLSVTLSILNTAGAVFSSLAAFTAVRFAYKRFPEEGRRQRELTADSLYQAYLARAMDNPELSWPRGTIPDDERYPWLAPAAYPGW